MSLKKHQTTIGIAAMRIQVRILGMLAFKAFPLPASRAVAQVQVVVDSFRQRAADTANLDEVIDARAAYTL